MGTRDAGKRRGPMQHTSTVQTETKFHLCALAWCMFVSNALFVLLILTTRCRPCVLSPFPSDFHALPPGGRLR